MERKTETIVEVTILVVGVIILVWWLSALIGGSPPRGADYDVDPLYERNLVDPTEEGDLIEQ